MTAENLQERAGAITFKGKPMTLLGRALNVGDEAPDFHLTGGDLGIVNLDGLLGGGTRAAMLVVVPSLDTGVCSLESQKFNGRIGELPGGVAASVVSMDLPFAMARWAGAQEGGNKLGMLSDYRDHSFGLNFGLLIGELGLLTRAIVVIGRDRKIRYIQIVPEVAGEPDYDEALKAAAAAA
jgi:thiol peroxidase